MAEKIINVSTESTQLDIKALLTQIQSLQGEVKNLTDTMVYLIGAMIEKMPRVTSNDQMTVAIESGSVGISNNQDIRNVTGAITNLQQTGSKYVSGDNLNTAGLQHIYNNIVVS